MPSSEISIDGIASDVGSCALVIVPRWDHATRNSLDMLCVSTLLSQLFSECRFVVMSVVKPGGVTCPAPESSGRWVRRYRPVSVWFGAS
jgi:hypothetical protein